MATIQVKDYRMGLNTKANTGKISLRLEGGQEVTIYPDSAAEFAALAAILNKAPVGYDPDYEALMTGWETVT